MMVICINLGHLPAALEDCNFLLAPTPRSVSTASVSTEAVVEMGMENGNERGSFVQTKIREAGCMQRLSLCSPSHAAPALPSPPYPGISISKGAGTSLMPVVTVKE